MSPMVGKLLAQYQISEKLGEGGMGVVWKARDTHLDRFVALKTLPAERVADPERRRRFVQEAKAASALNHPNIVHIYDIAESDGVQFIAMEYVAGKTLDQVICHKGLRLNELLKYAIQIADALAQAHTAAIVHRDLKPSNIMVTENGLVKVLDFGLAKLAETTAGDLGETATIRAKSPVTEEGTVVGTAAYMSPEQAEAKKVDARSDIFSFGSVLYEMVTGRRAFHGDSKLSTLAAILREDPKPVSTTVPDVPRDLERIISHCLRKDPQRRFQHMADVKTLLEELKEESESGKLAAVVSAGAPVRRKSRLIWALAGAAVLLAVAATGLWFLRPASRPAPRAVPLTSYPGRQVDPAFSPDGKQVAFAWDGEKGDNFDIYVKLVDAGAPLRLTTNPADERVPVWSPDGRYVAFCRDVSGHFEIWMVPALGGAERKLGEAGLCDGLSWSPDGKYLALADKNVAQEPYSIFLLAIEIGEKHRLTSPPKEYFGDVGSSFSPDGKSLLLIRAHATLSDDLYVQPLTTDGKPRGEPRRLTFDKRMILFADWTANGRDIVYSAGQPGITNLWMISAAGGRPERLAVAGENANALSVSRSGDRLVYERDTFDLNIWRIPGPDSPDKKGSPSKFIASTQADMEPQFSPDGKRIAFTSARSGNYEIWICDRESRNPVQLTSFNGPQLGSPRWSPDSRWIAFDSPNAGNSDVYVIAADGGQPRRVTAGGSNNVRPSWSRDGRWIYFGSNRSGASQIWKQPSAGGQALQVTKSGGEEAFESADGKFLYWVKLGLPGIWRVLVEGGEETRVLDTSTESLWVVAGQGIYFFDLKNPDGAALRFHSFVTGKATLLRQFSKDTRVDTDSSSLSVSPDGQWVLYTQLDHAGSDLILVENYH